MKDYFQFIAILERAIMAHCSCSTNNLQSVRLEVNLTGIYRHDEKLFLNF